MGEARWQTLKAIWVHCQRPGCDRRRRVPARILDQVDEDCRSRLHQGGDYYRSIMIELPDGWSVGMDPEGALYGVCPVDTAATRAPMAETT